MTDKANDIIAELLDSPDVEIVSDTDQLNAVLERLLTQTSPVQSLVRAYETAPHPVFKGFIDAKVIEILRLDLPRYAECMIHEGILSTSDDRYQPIAQTLTEGLAYAEKHDPEAETANLSATEKDAIGDVAHAVDKAMRRIVLDGTEVNKLAYFETVAAFAALTAALMNIALDDETREALARANKEVSAAIIGGDDESDS